MVPFPLILGLKILLQRRGDGKKETPAADTTTTITETDDTSVRDGMAGIGTSITSRRPPPLHKSGRDHQRRSQFLSLGLRLPLRRRPSKSLLSQRIPRPPLLRLPRL